MVRPRRMVSRSVPRWLPALVLVLAVGQTGCSIRLPWTSGASQPSTTTSGTSSISTLTSGVTPTPTAILTFAPTSTIALTPTPTLTPTRVATLTPTPVPTLAALYIRATSTPVASVVKPGPATSSSSTKGNPSGVMQIQLLGVGLGK